MSSGSWAGTIGGTEPPGFSPYAKEYFQAVYGGNWQKALNINFTELTSAGARVTLRQADEEGQVVRISLPDKERKVVDIASGNFAYYSKSGDDLDNSMMTSLDLSQTVSPILTFKTWYDIEQDWDYASVQVKEEGSTEWVTVAGNITTTTNPYEQNPGHGITGTSNGWVDAVFDLTTFAGKKVELRFNYWTDGAVSQNGFFADNITVGENSSAIFSDDAEGTPKFTFDGFEKSSGSAHTAQYYLVEWRNHHGVDKGLAHVSTLGQTFSYNPGMVVWYVDNSYTDNWTGVHPGGGYLSVVDADQNNILWQWTDPTLAPMLASNKYQMRDAAFSKEKESEFKVDLTQLYGRYVTDNNRFTESNFDDSSDYSNPGAPTLGVKLPSYGLKIQITEQAQDNSSASITIKK
jgi:immune inhibitor A